MELRITKPKGSPERAARQIKALENKEKNNIHKDHRSRLKSQFVENGVDTLTDIQKLELLLFYAIPQKDTNPIAHALISTFGSLTNVFLADYSSLLKVPGVKENTATLIRFVGAMLNYCERSKTDELVIDASAKAKDFATSYHKNVPVEQFYVYCLTASNKVQKAVLINSGTASSVDVQIRDITQAAIEYKCDRIIVSHNHPNGKAAMSDQDCRFTYSLMCSCLLNNIELLDHIIVGKDKAISLLEHGVIENLRERAANTIQIAPEIRRSLSEVQKSYIKSQIEE